MQPVRTKKKLSRADRKQIEAAIARANRTDKKEKSAQDSIPYERMWPDGICRVSDGHYTKTIQFQDINDELEFLLPAPVPKEKAVDVAVELYGFCPDLDQNEDGSIGSLADALWQSTVWYFWWD